MASQPLHSFPHTFDAGRYSRLYLFSHVPEEQVQKDVHDALALLGIEAAVIDAGFSAIRGKIYSAMLRCGSSPKTASTALQCLSGIAAAPPGWTDLCGCLPPHGRAFYLEIKAPAWLNPKTGAIVKSAGKPSPAQMDFMNRMAKRGALVGVAWSIEDALEILQLTTKKPEYGNQNETLTDHS